MQTNVVLETRELTKDFGYRAVLRRIDLQVRTGEMIGLLGGNGAGKTTLLCCLAGLVRPTSGEVRWLGRPVGEQPSQRRSIGMVAHESRLYPRLTLRENLVFTARMYGVRQPAERAVQGLTEVGLEAHADRFPGQVSRGMCQRAALARALIHEPQVLLLDEPFSGLDGDGVEWLESTLVQLGSAERTICFTTHNMTLAQRIADRLWRLESGRLREDSPATGVSVVESPPWKRAA